MPLFNHHSPSPATISDDGQLKLLFLTFKGLMFGIHALPLIGLPFVILLWIQGHTITGMIFWYIGCLLLNGWGLFRKQQFIHDMKAFSVKRNLRKWLPVIHQLAITYALGIGLLSPITADQESASFTYLLLTAQAAIVAGNATHLSPDIRTFNIFYVVVCTVIVATMPFIFTSEWFAIAFLAAIFILAIRHQAINSHKFFIQLVRLEDNSKNLANHYREAKEEAESALREKNQFLTTASHDLRQPIHAMGFLIESIIHRNSDDSLKAPLTDLRQSVRSATHMFNSLMDLSRIETGIVQIHQQPINLNDLIREISSTFQHEASSRHLTLRVHYYNKTDPVVVADLLMLKQSITNLLHNALRYTEDGGVLIGIRKRQNKWQIDVFDTGTGIATSDNSSLFTPFFRRKHAWNVDQTGLGLGLAVVARCSRLMGTDYGFNSIENKGSRFWLRLPVSAEIPIPNLTGSHQATLPSLASLDGVCLIIDDDPQVLSAWSNLMQAWGVTAYCASSSSDVGRLLEKDIVPQAILCDQRLRSGESGIGILKNLLDQFPDASGAMVSGEYSSEELLQAEEEGYLVLRKPLEPYQLHALLSQWLTLQ